MRVAGVVVAGEGPVGGARVELRSAATRDGVLRVPIATTDEEGRFDLGLQPAMAHYLVVLSDDYAPAFRLVRLDRVAATRNAADLKVRLDQCQHHVRGRVLDMNGGAIENAFVHEILPTDRWEWPIPLHGVTSARDGGFALCYGPGAIVVSADGYGSVKIRPSSPARDHDVMLFPESRVEGLLHDEHGAPVAGVGIALSPKNSLAHVRSPVIVARTAEDGSFLLHGAGPGVYQVVGSAPGYAQGVVTGDVVALPGRDISGLAAVIKRRQCAREIRGKVLEGDQPVGGAVFASVYLSPNTREDGSFVLPCVSSDEADTSFGWYKITGFEIVDPKRIPAGTESIEGLTIRVRTTRGSGRLAGSVTVDGKPVAGALVETSPGIRWTPPEDVPANATTSVGDGDYSLDAVAFAKYSLRATHFAMRRRSGLVDYDLTSKAVLENVNLELERAGRISGRIIDPAGVPVRNAKVIVKGPDMARCFNHEPCTSVLTNDEGEFEFWGLAAGEYTVSPAYPLRPQGDEKWPLAIVLPTPTAVFTKTLTVVREPIRAVAGRVVYDDGQPAARALVWTGDQQVIAGDDGRFELRPPAGRAVEIVALSLEGTKPDTRIRTSPGTTSVSIEVPRAGAVDALVDGSCDRCVVRVYQSNRAQVRTAVVSDRSVRIDTLVPGDYELKVFHPKKGVVSKASVSVASGKTTKAHLKMVTQATIRGRVKLFPRGGSPPPLRCNGGTGAVTDSEGRFVLNHVFPGPVKFSCYSRTVRAATSLDPVGREERGGTASGRSRSRRIASPH